MSRSECKEIQKERGEEEERKGEKEEWEEGGRERDGGGERGGGAGKEEKEGKTGEDEKQREGEGEKEEKEGRREKERTQLGVHLEWRCSSTKIPQPSLPPKPSSIFLTEKCPELRAGETQEVPLYVLMTLSLCA